MMVESWTAPLETGDPERAWDLFVARYRGLIFGAIRHYTGEPDDVMDVFARVCEAFREKQFARLRRCAAHAEPTRPLSTWLVAVVHNLTIDWFRHRDGRPRLAAVAATLPPLQQRIFECVFVDGHSHVETYDALGAHDAATAQHVEACPTCRSEIEQLQETAGLLRGQAVLERRTETPDCLDELVVADFIDGRLDADARESVVAHLLSCARCRSVVKATSCLAADTTVPDQTPARRWRRWSIGLGLAAAAAFVLLLLPSGGGDNSSPGLREPPDTSIHAPLLIAPRGSVARVDRLLWAGVPGVERYRVRLYNDEGDVLWTTETADTLVALPDSVGLSHLATYFWKVEAQTEWKRWVSSDLVEFRFGGPSR